MVDFLRVSKDNDQWQAVILEWEAQCREYGEDLVDYATASLPVLETLATETQRKNAGVYAVKDGDSHLGLCQMNSALLPGYEGYVLRVRHIVHAPKFDFDDQMDVEDYSKMLAGLLVGVVGASNDEMQSPHIKFHFKSPAERMYFQALRNVLRERTTFSSIEMQGSWLYISK